MRHPLFTLPLVLSLIGASPSLAAPGFYGTTGLFATPVAAVAPRGAWSAGANYVSRDFRPGASSISKGSVAHCFTLTLLPRLELAAVFTNYEGRLGARNLNHGLTPDRDLGGYTIDRMVTAQWLVLPQRDARPAVALGIRDITGTVQLFKAYYGVTSLRRGRLTVSAGLGTGLLHGPFGGAEFALTPGVTAVAEGLHGQVNGGFRLVPLKDFQLDAALMGFRSLGGGMSYRRRF